MGIIKKSNTVQFFIMNKDILEIYFFFKKEKYHISFFKPVFVSHIQAYFKDRFNYKIHIPKILHNGKQIFGKILFSGEKINLLLQRLNETKNIENKIVSWTFNPIHFWNYFIHSNNCFKTYSSFLNSYSE